MDAAAGRRVGLRALTDGAEDYGQIAEQQPKDRAKTLKFETVSRRRDMEAGK